MVRNLDSPLILEDNNRPPVSQLLEFLLTKEKNNKKTKENLTFAALVGTWRLYFITGTQKAKKRAGIVLGKGSLSTVLVKNYGSSVCVMQWTGVILDVTLI